MISTTMKKKSTYQNCYKSPDEDALRSSYFELLKTRAQRRELEHAHVAFQWDSDGSDTDNGEPKDLDEK